MFPTVLTFCCRQQGSFESLVCRLHFTACWASSHLCSRNFSYSPSLALATLTYFSRASESLWWCNRLTYFSSASESLWWCIGLQHDSQDRSSSATWCSSAMTDDVFISHCQALMAFAGFLHLSMLSPSVCPPPPGSCWTSCWTSCTYTAGNTALLRHFVKYKMFHSVTQQRWVGRLWQWKKYIYKCQERTPRPHWKYTILIPQQWALNMPCRALFWKAQAHCRTWENSTLSLAELKNSEVSEQQPPNRKPFQ